MPPRTNRQSQLYMGIWIATGPGGDLDALPISPRGGLSVRPARRPLRAFLKKGRYDKAVRAQSENLMGQRPKELRASLRRWMIEVMRLASESLSLYAQNELYDLRTSKTETE